MRALDRDLIRGQSVVTIRGLPTKIVKKTYSAGTLPIGLIGAKGRIHDCFDQIREMKFLVAKKKPTMT